jgi:hypothetical protein
VFGIAVERRDHPRQPDDFRPGAQNGGYFHAFSSNKE